MYGLTTEGARAIHKRDRAVASLGLKPQYN